MSFLNPVNEPVLRFKSTDAGAPQINYNARTAGDVKAVLKACLVTGYGSTASAGWSIVNEVDHVCEFVSPSVAMSDYRLGIDDTSTSNTNWYYTKNNGRVNPLYNSPVKSFSAAEKSHASNGWQMLVTPLGLILIELIKHSIVNGLSARITCMGALKSAIKTSNDGGMCFFSIGHNSTIILPAYFYSRASTYVHTSVAGMNQLDVSTATQSVLSRDDTVLGLASVDVISAVYLTNASVVAELPALLSLAVADQTSLYTVKDIIINSRPALMITAGHADNDAGRIRSRARAMACYLDYWEY